MLFIAGIVKAPVVTVLAIDEPEIVPINADEKIATLAGPPENLPAMTIAKSMNNCPSLRIGHVVASLLTKILGMNRKTY